MIPAFCTRFYTILNNTGVFLPLNSLFNLWFAYGGTCNNQKEWFIALCFILFGSNRLSSITVRTGKVKPFLVGSTLEEGETISYDTDGSLIAHIVRNIPILKIYSLIKIRRTIHEQFDNIVSIVDKKGYHWFYTCQNTISTMTDFMRRTKVKSVGLFGNVQITPNNFLSRIFAEEVDFSGLINLEKVKGQVLNRSSRLQKVVFDGLVKPFAVGDSSLNYCYRLNTIKFTNCTHVSIKRRHGSYSFGIETIDFNGSSGELFIMDLLTNVHNYAVSPLPNGKKECNELGTIDTKIVFTHTTKDKIASVLNISSISPIVGSLPLERSDSVHLSQSNMPLSEWNIGPMWDVMPLSIPDIWQKNKHMRANNKDIRDSCQVQ